MGGFKQTIVLMGVEIDLGKFREWVNGWGWSYPKGQNEEYIIKTHYPSFYTAWLQKRKTVNEKLNNQGDFKAK